MGRQIKLCTRKKKRMINCIEDDAYLHNPENQGRILKVVFQREMYLADIF